ncbi:MAG: hypothetical protein LUC99_06910 [Clostridiales bacterium]|nr:hypothetical protein [Clostridiales bacterium]
MGKRCALRKAATIFAVLLALSGCAGQEKAAAWEGNDNSIYIQKDGKVESALVYSSAQPNEYYRQDELSVLVEEVVASYNKEKGARASAHNSESGETLPVGLVACSLEGRTGRLVFEYSSPAEYLAFAETTNDDTNSVTALAVSSLADAIAAGAPQSAELVRPDGSAAGKIRKPEKYVAVAVEGEATIYTEGKIIWISSGVAVEGDYRARTGEGVNYIVFKR